LDVHHVKPFRDFGVANYLEANQLDNLVTLCKPCHMAIEKTLPYVMPDLPKDRPNCLQLPLLP
jgi:predicted HNH restriction endonuclease